MQSTTIGLDIAKHVFHLVACDDRVNSGDSIPIYFSSPELSILSPKLVPGIGPDSRNNKA